jgi:hypothetical protein
MQGTSSFYVSLAVILKSFNFYTPIEGIVASTAISGIYTLS